MIRRGEQGEGAAGLLGETRTNEIGDRIPETDYGTNVLEGQDQIRIFFCPLRHQRATDWDSSISDYEAWLTSGLWENYLMSVNYFLRM